MIEVLHGRIDAFFRKAVEDGPGEIACKPGCTSCCRVDLTVFPVEAARVREALRALPAEVRAEAAGRARAGRHCALLDDAGRCVAYPARPAICRSHGLAIRIDGRIDACPLNYRNGPPRRESILDVETLNEALVRLDVAAGGRGERFRLADLVLEAEDAADRDA